MIVAAAVIGPAVRVQCLRRRHRRCCLLPLQAHKFVAWLHQISSFIHALQQLQKVHMAPDPPRAAASEPSTLQTLPPAHYP